MATFDLGRVVGEKGAKGDKGNGISSIILHNTNGKTKTYRITLTNGSTFDFNVVDGNDGNVDIITSWQNTLSDSKVPSEKLVKNNLDDKASLNHTHGNIDKDGTIGSVSGKPLITTTGGAITAGSFGTSSGTFSEGNHTHSAYINPQIVDNLNSNDANKVLSAKQGKVLNDLIGQAISYINQ